MGGSKKGGAKVKRPAEEEPAPLAQEDAQPSVASELQQLEAKRKDAGSQLREVERRIYDLETKYLENCNQQGNALKGYELLLTQPQPASKSRQAPVVVRSEDRLFSSSSTTGTLHLAR